MIDSVDQNSQVQYETSSNHQSQSYWCSLQLKFLIKTCGQLQKLFLPIFVAYDYKRKKCVNNLWSQAFVGQMCNLEDLDLKMAKKAQGLHYVNINININIDLKISVSSKITRSDSWNGPASTWNCRAGPYPLNLIVLLHHLEVACRFLWGLRLWTALKQTTVGFNETKKCQMPKALLTQALHAQS